jgi:glycosyltransferase involved in cell wall biosynthesis
MNDKKGLISIIVPVYKAEKYLSRCVESLLSQTYKNIEIILIDDDSPDNCPQLCDNYAKQYKNINVIHLKDSGIGVSGARNAGLDNASGEYVAFVDSDDFVHSDFFSILKNVLETNSTAKMSICSYQKVSESTKQFDTINSKNEIILDDMGAMNLIIDDQNMSAVWSKLYMTSIFEDLRFPLGKHNEDMFLMPFIFQKAKNIVYTPQPLYYYFQDNESLCRAAFNYNMLDMIYAIEVWENQIKKQYPSLVYKVRSHYYTSVFNISQYLANKNDAYGNDKFSYFQQKINANFFYILGSKYISLNNKFKLFLFKTKLFRPFFRMLDSLNIKSYQ